MIILKEGTRNKITCSKCGSLLQFSDSDVRLHPIPREQWDWDDYDGPEDHYGAHLICASCGHQIGIQASSPLKRQILQSERDI
jgi:hypothetical protein